MVWFAQPIDIIQNKKTFLSACLASVLFSTLLLFRMIYCFHTAINKKSWCYEKSETESKAPKGKQKMISKVQFLRPFLELGRNFCSKKTFVNFFRNRVGNILMVYFLIKIEHIFVRPAELGMI
jgi:hypothetical protein